MNYWKIGTLSVPAVSFIRFLHWYKKMLYISTAVYLETFNISLTFNNGTQGILDFQPLIFQDRRPIFNPLRDKEYFKQFKLQAGTLCWPNELDLAPEFLFFQLFQDTPEYQARFKAWGYTDCE